MKKIIIAFDIDGTLINNTYISDGFIVPNRDNIGENSEEKLGMIDEFIREELIEEKPDWYVNIIKELDSLHSMSGEHYKYNTSIIESIQNLKADYGRVFLNK